MAGYVVSFVLLFGRVPVGDRLLRRVAKSDQDARIYRLLGMSAVYALLGLFIMVTSLYRGNDGGAAAALVFIGGSLILAWWLYRHLAR